MANRQLTNDIIAKEALMILDNELVMGNKVFRGYEDEFDDKTNGYKRGDTVAIRRPVDFTVRDGAVMAVQDVEEGKTSIVVDKQKGVDFRFTSKELTLNIDELSERVIKPAMVQIANQIERDLMGLYVSVPSWVGTPGQVINSFADFYVGIERLDEYSVPSGDLSGVLSPQDHSGLIGAQTGLYIESVAKDAYRKGSLGMLGGVDTYMAQNVPTHTTGTDMAGTINASVVTSTITYTAVKDTMQQTLTTASFTPVAGDVFEIQDVYAVNPVTKARLPFLKQFTVVSYTSNAPVISPAMIWTGAHKNVDITAVTDLNAQTITAKGTASTGYRQNMIFHKNAFALVSVPMVSPAGATDVTRKSYKGMNVRLIPVYDGVNDVSAYRLDVLYGVKAIDPRLATRLSGT